MVFDEATWLRNYSSLPHASFRVPKTTVLLALQEINQAGDNYWNSIRQRVAHFRSTGHANSVFDADMEYQQEQRNFWLQNRFEWEDTYLNNRGDNFIKVILRLANQLRKWEAEEDEEKRVKAQREKQKRDAEDEYERQKKEKDARDTHEKTIKDLEKKVNDANKRLAQIENQNRFHAAHPRTPAPDPILSPGSLAGLIHANPDDFDPKTGRHIPNRLARRAALKADMVVAEEKRKRKEEDNMMTISIAQSMRQKEDKDVEDAILARSIQQSMADKKPWSK